MLETPWGELAVSDAHVHFFSYKFLQLLTGRDPVEVAAQLGWEAPAAEPEALAARWVNELKRNHVTRAAIIASLPGDESSVAAAVAAHPARFHGCFLFNPLAPDPVERLKTAFASGLRTVCLFPSMHRFSLAAKELDPVYEAAAAQSGAVLFAHCGVLSVGIREKLDLPSQFDMRFSNPIDLHPAALRHPNLKFQIPHFGAGYFREALIVAGLCPNVYLDTSSSNSWMKYEALDLETVFRRTLKAIGPERIVFGTDSSFFPRGWHKAIFDKQVEALAAIGISAEDANRIFNSNFEKLTAA